MKINYNKLCYAIKNNGKLPRKLKKKVLGHKMKKSHLKKLLASVKVIKPAKTMYETPEITPFLFCPHCGCIEVRTTGQMSSYPEHWEEFYCLRCNKKVAFIDNSPLIHCLQYYVDGELDYF